MAEPLATLQIARDGVARDAVDVLTASVTVGRSAPGYEPDVPLDDPDSYVSRRHCVFTHDAGAWWVEDSGSRNGTFVRRGGARVTLDGRMALEPADVVCIVASRGDDGAESIWELELIDPNATQTLGGVAGLAPRTTVDRPMVRWDGVAMRLEVIGDGEPRLVELRKQGYDLIGHMAVRNAANGGQPVVCTSQELLEAVWGDPAQWDRYRPPTTDNLRDLVLAVRKAIEPDAKKPVILENQRGVGYKLHSAH